ncbi:hypothetical protein FBR04_20965 [Betaproteobacteria bacterium PRO7]|jgi:hypothetical protein|nr:hypothetical protein [Betaproteobacteria bacterium PRO7]GIK84800.1 MAG: hypothetical protein BroJett026_02810 [Betaproteobacteria bacterium]
MKRRLAAAALIAAAAPAFAADINSIQLLSQNEFRLLSEDLGAALSFKPLIPSEALGITGFDLGVAVTGTKLKNDAILKKASSGSDVPSVLPVPTLRLHKGLPLNLDVGVAFSQVPGTNIRYTGGELRWAILPGSTLTPAVAIRGTLTRLTGVDQLDFDTKSLDISISKGFANITPYGGIGQVWIKSTPKGVPGLRGEDFTQTKVFGGVNVNFGLANLAFEADSTGGTTTVGAKLGFRF